MLTKFDIAPLMWIGDLADRHDEITALFSDAVREIINKRYNDIVDVSDTMLTYFLYVYSREKLPKEYKGILYVGLDENGERVISITKNKRFLIALDIQLGKEIRDAVKTKKSPFDKIFDKYIELLQDAKNQYHKRFAPIIAKRMEMNKNKDERQKIASEKHGIRRRFTPGLQKNAQGQEIGLQVGDRVGAYVDDGKNIRILGYGIYQGSKEYCPIENTNSSIYKTCAILNNGQQVWDFQATIVPELALKEIVMNNGFNRTIIEERQIPEDIKKEPRDGAIEIEVENMS